MVHTPAEFVVQYLVNQSLLNWADAAGAWPTIVGIMPDEDEGTDEFISVTDMGAFIDGKIHKTGQTVQHPDIMIQLRSASYRDAKLKGDAIADALSSLHRVEVTIETETVEIQSATIVIPTTFFKELEKNRRQLFSLNIRVSFN